VEPLLQFKIFTLALAPTIRTDHAASLDYFLQFHVNIVYGFAHLKERSTALFQSA